jgi:hypothetical protein
MSSLGAALPNANSPSSFLGGVTQPWFPQDLAMTYIPAAPQGKLSTDSDGRNSYLFQLLFYGDYYGQTAH